MSLLLTIPEIYPAPIWIVLVSNKRRLTSKRFATDSKFVKPIRLIAVVGASSFPEATAVLKSKRYRQFNGEIKQFKVFGRPTTNTKVVGPLVLDLAVRRPKKIRGNVTLGLPTKSVVVVVSSFPEAISVILQARKVKRPKLTKYTKLGKTFGRPTTKPSVRPILLIDFAISQVKIKRKFQGTIKVGAIPRLFVPTPPAPTVSRNSGMLAAKHVRRLMRKR